MQTTHSLYRACLCSRPMLAGVPSLLASASTRTPTQRSSQRSLRPSHLNLLLRLRSVLLTGPQIGTDPSTPTSPSTPSTTLLHTQLDCTGPHQKATDSSEASQGRVELDDGKRPTAVGDALVRCTDGLSAALWGTSARTGQVYRASTHDGREVAVKVQRPDAMAVLAKDYSAMSRALCDPRQAFHRLPLVRTATSPAL